MVKLTKDIFKKLTEKQLKELGNSMTMPIRGGAPQPDALGDIISPNPVFSKNNKWYFWDEVWVEKYGPFDTKEEAECACVKYAETL